MSSISKDSYFTFEQAVEDWNAAHKDKYLSPATAKTLNFGKEIFVKFNEKTGFRILEGSFWSRFQSLDAYAKKQVDLWKVLEHEHYHAYAVLTNPFASRAEKKKILAKALDYCRNIPFTIPEKERMVFIDLILRKYLKSKSSDFSEDFIRGFIFCFSSSSKEEFKKLLPVLKEILYQAKAKINSETDISYIEVISQFEIALDARIGELRTKFVEDETSIIFERIYHQSLDSSPFLSGDIDRSVRGSYSVRACQSVCDLLFRFKKTRISEAEQKQLQQLFDEINLAKEIEIYSNGAADEVATVTKIHRAIENLKTKIPPYIILMGGSKSHAILYKIAWNSSRGSYQMSIINTGAGADRTKLHSSGARLEHRKVTNTEYLDIPPEKLNRDFFEKIIISRYGLTTDQAIKFIDELLGGKNRAFGKEHIAQYRGTCSFACQLAWLREEMDPKLYAEFEVFMAQTSVELLDEQIKKMSAERFKIIFTEAENQEETLRKFRGMVVYSLEESQRRLKEGVSESSELKRLDEDIF